MTRASEAQALVDYIALAGFPTNDFLMVAGDLNNETRNAVVMQVLTSNTVTDDTQPADQNGNTDTSSARVHPYDYILPSCWAEEFRMPLYFENTLFQDGMVFDTRLWTNTPPPSPALITDSSAYQMNHMLIMKQFAMERPFRITTTAGSNGTITPRNPGVSAGASQFFTVTPEPYYVIHELLTNGTSAGGAGTSSYTLVWSNVLADGSMDCTFEALMATHNVPQWWLAAYGLTNDFDAAVSNDIDKDGFYTWEEYIGRTDPTNEYSLLVMEGLRFDSNGQAQLMWQSVTGRVYNIQQSTNGPAGLWSTVAADYPAARTGDLTGWTNTVVFSNGTPCFRVVVTGN